jgi:hypothetical protein
VTYRVHGVRREGKPRVKVGPGKRRMGLLELSNVFWISTLVGGDWSASRPGRFIPREWSPMYPLDSRLCGSQTTRRKEKS